MGELGDLWRGVLLALRDRRRSNGVQREQAMLQGARATMQAYQGKEGRNSGSLDLGEGRLHLSPMVTVQKAERILVRRILSFLIGFRNASGHLDSAWHSCLGVRVKSQSQNSRAPLPKDCFLQVGEAGGEV